MTQTPHTMPACPPPFVSPANALFNLGSDQSVGFFIGHSAGMADACGGAFTRDQHNQMVVIKEGGAYVLQGRDYKGPGPLESMFALTQGFLEGVAATEALDCQTPAATVAIAATFDIIEKAREAGRVRQDPFIKSCVARSSTLNAVGCDCLALSFMMLRPEIYLLDYTDNLVNELNSRNPFLWMAMAPTCAAYQYIFE